MRRMMKLPLSLLMALTCSWGFTQVPTPAQAQVPNRLVALGSGSLEPVVLLWRDSYRSIDPGFELDVLPEGSGNAPKALISGNSQFALMSREMTPEEVAAFKAKMGYTPTRIAVAMDALVVLVNKNNPIKEIKIEQLDAVFSSTRLQGWPKDITLWGELGVTQGNWATRTITRWGRPKGSSGTRTFFIEAVELGGKGKEDTKRPMDESGVSEELIANQAAIGYGSLADVYDSLKTVPIVPKGGKSAVAATLETVADGGYPLSRFLFIYVNKAPGKPLPPRIAGFLNYALSPDGQKVLKAVGQVALPEELVRLNRRRVN